LLKGKNTKCNGAQRHNPKQCKDLTGITQACRRKKRGYPSGETDGTQIKGAWVGEGAVWKNLKEKVPPGNGWRGKAVKVQLGHWGVIVVVSSRSEVEPDCMW